MEAVYKTEGEVFLALQHHFPKEQYAVLPHVANATGARHSRVADALVMSLWPSRGLGLYGVEIKVSRADWVRELNNPKKADEIARYCDYWWLAVGNKSIVKDGELPETWGLLVPGKEAGLRVSKSPTKLEAKPMDRVFLAAILRKAQEEYTPLAGVQAEIDRRVEEIRASVTEQVTRNLTRELDRDSLLKRVHTLEQTIAAFEKSSGLDITHGYACPDRAARIGKAVKTIEWSTLENWLGDFEHTVNRARDNLKKLRAALKANGLTTEGEAA